ncbi:MAG: choline-sulfatase, partial [Gammaproteobacteria bacterium]
MTNKSPNILVIQADQMTAKALSLYGHKLVKTPNIDRLAKGGTVFENAYCNFPLCVPSRTSMMAGRLPNDIGMWDNAIEMPASIPTLAHYLRSANYHTVLAGKMHFVGPDQIHGFDERIVTDIYPSNFAWTPDWVVGERYRPTGINMRAVVDSGVCARGLQIDYDEEVEHAGVQKLYDLARFNKENPFLLWVSFTHPHSPFITTQHYWDLYDHDDIDMPAVPEFDIDEMDTMSRWLYYAHGGDLSEVTDQHIRNARHAYYGMCSYIDDKVGKLLDTVELLGLEDDTVIVFTSDHGEMLGERGMWFKQSFHEWSVTVPMVIKVPGIESKERVSELVSLVDLLPTFMDIAT